MTIAEGNNARDTAQQRATTSDWLAEEGVATVLNREPRVSDGAGGYVAGPAAPIASQQFVRAATAIEVDDIVVDAGEINRLGFVLIGSWDADVVENDWFTVPPSQSRWLVTKVYPDRTYQTKATGRVITNADGLS